MRVTQSQNVPLSCLSRPLADRLAEAAYRDILGLSYARALSAEWNTVDRGYFSHEIDQYACRLSYWSCAWLKVKGIAIALVSFW